MQHDKDLHHEIPTRVYEIGLDQLVLISKKDMKKKDTSFLVKSNLPDLIVFIHEYYLEFGRTHFFSSIYLLFEVISSVTKQVT